MTILLSLLIIGILVLGISYYCFRIGFYVPPRKEIGLYEGVGILFAKPNTDYNLAGDHAEAIVDQPQLCERYRGFYLNYLLKDCVVSQDETLKILDSLIDIAKEAQH